MKIPFGVDNISGEIGHHFIQESVYTFWLASSWLYVVECDWAYSKSCIASVIVSPSSCWQWGSETKSLISGLGEKIQVWTLRSSFWQLEARDWSLQFGILVLPTPYLFFDWCSVQLQFLIFLDSIFSISLFSVWTFPILLTWEIEMHQSN